MLLHSNVIAEDKFREHVIVYHAYDWGVELNMSDGVTMFAPRQFHHIIPHVARPVRTESCTSLVKVRVVSVYNEVC